MLVKILNAGRVDDVIINENETVKIAVAKFGLSPEGVVVKINDIPASLDDVLTDGDILSIGKKVAGG